MKKIEAVILFSLCFIQFSFSQKIVKNGLSEVDLKGNVKSAKVYTYVHTPADTNHLVDKTIMYFDKSGNIIELRSHLEDVIRSKKITFKLDHAGRLFKEDIYTHDTISDWVTCRYDDRTDLMMQMHHFSKTDSVLESVRKFDANGNVTELTFYQMDGGLGARFIFTFNEKGNKTEWDVYKGDSIEHKHLYQYNTHNEEGVETVYKSNGVLLNTYTYEYEFDAMGNWTKKTRFENSVASQILEREIEYY